MMSTALELSPEELKHLLDQSSAVRLIDCRELDEWHICHIAGAQLIALSRFAEEALPKLGEDKEQHLVVYCHHGVRSMHATQWLRRAGYGKTQSLRGGIDLWAETVEPETPRY